MIEACTVAMLYGTILGRHVDPGADHWARMPAHEAAAHIVHSAEAGGAIDWPDAYRVLLGRDDAEGVAYWSSQPDQLDALAGFLGSPEVGCVLDPRTERQRIIDEIRTQAAAYGVDEAKALDVAFCESSFRADAKNPRSSARGVYQFIDRTWAWIATIGAPHPNADRYDYEANIENAMWLVRRDGWRHWACA